MIHAWKQALVVIATCACVLPLTKAKDMGKSEPLVIFFPSGSNESLTCKPHRNWTKNETWQANWTKGNETLDGNTPRLRLLNVSTKDEGTYHAHVYNGTATKNCTFSVTVIQRSRDPPKIIYLTPNTTANVSDCVILNCTVKSDASPYVTWQKQCTLDTEGNATAECEENFIRKSVPDDINLLVFPEVNVSDAGFYTCIAETIYGSDNKTTWLNVVPQFLGTQEYDDLEGQQDLTGINASKEMK